MKILLFLVLFFNFSHSNIEKAFVVALFSGNKSENVQHKLHTNYDYNGLVFSKVAIIGKYNKNTNVKVKIGNSSGKLVQNEPLYNSRTKIIYGYELTFQHEDVTKGYFEVFIDNKLFDTKLFVK